MEVSHEFMIEGKMPCEVVVLTDAVYHSYLGEYFFGQTDVITFSRDCYAWGGLVNTVTSNVNMYLNAYTITNFNNQAITAEGWLGSEFPAQTKISCNVAAGNQSLDPTPIPKVMVAETSMHSHKPSDGTYTFTRRVEPELTLTKHDFQGMYIIPPGSSFTLILMADTREQKQARIAFGWWEEKV